MQQFVTAAMLVCGLSGPVDGLPSSDAEAGLIRAPLSREIVDGLTNGGDAPWWAEFVGEPVIRDEWLIGLRREPDERMLIGRARKSRSGISVRVGWMKAVGENQTSFTETAIGDCTIERVSEPSAEAPE